MRGYDSTLSVRISESTVGLYLCRATVKDFKDVSASASVLMRGPPRILRSQRVQVQPAFTYHVHSDILHLDPVDGVTDLLMIL